MTAPPTEASLTTVMPVRVGRLPPITVNVPVLVLVTLPVTLMPSILMQLMAAELLTEL